MLTLSEQDRVEFMVSCAPFGSDSVSTYADHPKGVYFMHGTLEEWFWAKVIMPIDPTACWTWKGATHNFGYGALNDVGRMLRAHRVSWEIHNGPIPKGLWVLHHCDNPPCTNPHHLFLGTQKDNIRDAIQKGRFVVAPHRQGAQHPRAKLTAAQVVEIRTVYRLGISQRTLARLYNVSRGNICFILSNTTWPFEG